MKRASGLKIMLRLIKELQALLPIMIVTIFLGVIGFLAAILISGFAIVALGALLGEQTELSFMTAISIMGTLAILRGFFRYGEQLSGHYVAFKILMHLRDQIFSKLRKLAPAKLETKAKGELVALVTSDIEMLEVFYAHTIAPIAIAIITSVCICFLLFQVHVVFAGLAGVFFLLIGVGLPLYASKSVGQAGMAYREAFNRGNTIILDSLYGLKEIIHFGQQRKQTVQVAQQSQELNRHLEILKRDETTIAGLSDILISLALISATLSGLVLYQAGTIQLTALLFAVVVLASAFGPVVALSRLANTLGHTFACAQRLFQLLDEEPLVAENPGVDYVDDGDVELKDVSFRYPGQKLTLQHIRATLKRGTKIAIVGPSGSGKSTLFKLLLRYFDPQTGEIRISDRPLTEMATQSLRTLESAMSQETFLFNDTIRANIALGNPTASLQEIQQAAKKAALHDWITQLPAGYETKVGELGSLISSGERQRLGLARIFLHDGVIFLLDEPTSNLDALNEAEILQSLHEYAGKKTVIFSSHRQSTTAIADTVYQIERGVMCEKKI